MLVDITVAEIMTSPVDTIRADASVVDAASRLADGPGSLVVSTNGDVTGIVTRSDLVRALGAGRTDAPIADVMTTPVTSVGAGYDLATAARVLGDADVGQVVVLDDADELVGVLSATDVVDYVPALAHRRDGAGSSAGAGVEVEGGAEPEGRDRYGHVRRPGRVDTAYEEDDWRFEYDGGDGIAVGDVARFSKPITESDVDEFAHATGDTNRLHLDAAFASGTRFGRQVVHGVLSLGLVSAALARMPGAIIYLSQECSYLAPVDVGERVTARCEVVDDLGGDRYRLDVGAHAADGEELLEGGSTILVDDVPEV